MRKETKPHKQETFTKTKVDMAKYYEAIAISRFETPAVYQLGSVPARNRTQALSLS